MLFLLASLSYARTLDFSGDLLPTTTVSISNGFDFIVAPQPSGGVAVVLTKPVDEMTGIDFWHDYGCIPSLGWPNRPWPTVEGRYGGIGGIWTFSVSLGYTAGTTFTEETTLAVTLGNTSAGDRMSVLYNDHEGGVNWAVLATPIGLPTTTTALGSALLTEVYGVTPTGWRNWASRHTGQTSGSTAYDGPNPSDVGEVADLLPDGFPGKGIVKAVSASMQAIKDLADFLRGGKTVKDAEETKEKLEDDKESIVGAIVDLLGED
jgi:hypothetical protein